MSETAGDCGALRDLIWEVSGAVAKAAPGLRREARENENFRERLSSLRSQQLLSAEDRSFWADLLEGKLFRTRGRPSKQTIGQPFSYVSGAIFRKAAETPAVQELVRVLRRRDEEIPVYARALFAELFVGRLVRSTGHSVVRVDERIEELRPVAEAYVAERAKGATAEEAAEEIGGRLKMHERTVSEYVAEWQRLAPYLGPKLPGKSE